MKKIVLYTLGLSIALPAFSQEPVRQLSPQDAGLNVLIPDTVAFRLNVDNQGNWEPETSVMGDGTLLLVANTYGESDPGGASEVAKVILIRPDGTIIEHAGFLADDGSEYLENMDAVRQDGNPAKIAGDQRPGSTRYAVANESTPMDFEEFGAGERWDNLYFDHIFATQILELTETGPTKVTNVIDPVYGAQSGLDVGRIRTGGIVFLSNGNLLVGAEDRSGLGATDRDPQLSILDGETGEILNGPFHAIGDGSQHSFWESIAAFNGGFVARVGDDPVNTLNFYDNDGNKLGIWSQVNDPDPVADIDNPNIPLEFPNDDGFTTTITTTGRGDGEEIESHINSDFVYYAGTGPDSFTGAGENFVYVTKINAQTRESVKEAVVNVDEFNAADRVFVAVDGNDNVFVGWSDNTATGTTQIIGRFFDSDLEPATDPFIVFQQGILPDGTSNALIEDINVYHGSAAMDTNRLLVGARTSSYLLSEDDDPLPNNSNMFTVIESPFAGTTVPDWTVY